jgi:serine O-acetyltransferase
MKLNRWLKDNSSKISEEICMINDENIFNSNCLNQTSKDSIIKVLHDLRSLILPGIYETEELDYSNLLNVTDSRFRMAAIELCHIIENVLMEHCRYEGCGRPECNECKTDAEEFAVKIMKQMPDIRRTLETDIEAAYEGDPAAKSFEEIILSYPSFEAISIYRIAHAINGFDIPLIPRIMTEYAHERTGIDIHPNATIGQKFFIDHGTGVVVGETCTIGKNVKVYQGVTLGAKSFPVDKNGKPIKNIKRHPDIGDNVVIYAGATILGGNTQIGKNSIVGGNVWLTHSVPENTTVFNAQPSPILKQMDKEDM